MNERELLSGVSIVTLLPRPVQLMLYLTMAEKTSVGGCHVMLMYREPVLVMVMFVGYAVNEQGNRSAVVICYKSKKCYKI